MSEEIKIMWIDDEMDVFDLMIPELVNHYEKVNLKITVIPVEKTSKVPMEALYDIDIVLADYNLDTKKVNGKDVIIKIRDSSCVANIILYSDNQDITKLKVLKQELGHYAVSEIIYKRSNLKEKVYQLIDRTLKSIEDLVILRGLIIAETIDVELKINELLMKYYGINKKNEEDFNNHILENKYLAFFVKSTFLDQIYKTIPDGEYKEKMKQIRKNVNEIIEKRNEFAHCKEQENQLIKFGNKPIEINYRSVKSLRKMMKFTILLINGFIRDYICSNTKK